MKPDSPTAPEVHYDPFSEATQRDPYEIYNQLLEFQPLYHNAEQDFWALSRFEAVRDAARDWRRFSSSQGVRVDELLSLAGPAFIAMDPPRHGILRDLVRSPFDPRAIRSLEQIIERLAIQLISDFADDDEVDLALSFAKRLPVLVICEMLGLPHHDASMLKAWGDDLLASSSNRPGAAESAREAGIFLSNYWEAQFQKRRRHAGDDLISRLVATDVDPPMTDAERVGMCNLLFEAGNSTTTSLIGNGVLQLAQHPDELAWLQDDLDRLPIAIEELLRYDAPVQNQVRIATEDVEIGGGTIPRGGRVMLLLGAANRDPRVWHDPNRLILARTPRRNLAFGEGIHHCLGAHLARLEGRIALRLLLTELPPLEVVSYERFHDVTLRMLDHLVVRFRRS